MDFIAKVRAHTYALLRMSERYFKTDMVYFAQGNFWLFIGRGVATASGFLLTIAFANWLTPEAFGTYKYIVAIAGVIAALSLNGLGGAALRAIGQGHQNVLPSLFRMSMLWSIPASILAFLGGAYYLYNGNGTLGWSLVVIAVVNPLIANLGISKALFAATGDFRRATIYNSIRSIAQVAIVALALLITTNVLVIAATFFIASAVVGYLTYWHSLRVLKITDDREHFAETFSYTKHLSVLGAIQLIVGQLDQLLLWHFAGPLPLAIYAIALGPTRELRAFGDSVAALAFPRISAKNASDASVSVRQKSKTLLVVYIGIACLYMLAAPFLFEIFFPQYLNAILPSQILAFGFIFQSRAFQDVFLLSHGTTKDRYAMTIPGQVIKAVLLVGLIPFFGLWGAVVATLAAELTTAITTSLTFRRREQQVPQDTPS